MSFVIKSCNFDREKNLSFICIVNPMMQRVFFSCFGKEYIWREVACGTECKRNSVLCWGKPTQSPQAYHRMGCMGGEQNESDADQGTSKPLLVAEYYTPIIQLNPIWANPASIPKCFLTHQYNDPGDCEIFVFLSLKIA